MRQSQSDPNFGARIPANCIPKAPFKYWLLVTYESNMSGASFRLRYSVYVRITSSQFITHGVIYHPHERFYAQIFLCPAYKVEHAHACDLLIRMKLKLTGAGGSSDLILFQCISCRKVPQPEVSELHPRRT